MQSKDLLFWANRYHLFVSWSSDRSHPWDARQAASEYVTLEIGVARGTANKVRASAWACMTGQSVFNLLLDGYSSDCSPALLLAKCGAPSVRQSRQEWHRRSALECGICGAPSAVRMRLTLAALPVQAVVLLNGAPITDYTMTNCVLKTT